MRKRKYFLVLLLALFSIVGWAQQLNYDGQHVSIMQTAGDSIQYDLGHMYQSRFRPIVENGVIKWEFTGFQNFTLSDVKSFEFRNYEYDEKVVREALIEFYQKMDGDSWPRHDNWCSDKPIWEWYGINGVEEPSYIEPWVKSLWLNCTPINKEESGELPDCIQRMGPIYEIAIPLGGLVGEIPAFLANMYSLQVILFNANKLTGTIPAGIGKLPNLLTFGAENNNLSGPLPEEFILCCMNKSHMPGNNLDIANNNFSGKVPKSIQNHPRFADFWPGIVIQNTPLDVSDLVIPAPDFTTTDIDGNTINLGEIYKKNKYTLLYKWGLWCPWSDVYNQQLVPAFKAYKDKGLEVIGIHYDLNYDDGLAEYKKDHDIPWRNIIARDWDGHNFNGTGIFQWGGTPNVFLVDQDGHIVFNSLMDKDGNPQFGTLYRNNLFAYLEDKLGPIEYDFYTSTDYSKDGEVSTLQTATTGQGVDLVFVGEGFTDKDIEEGTFDQRMNDAVQQFFAYEPYASLRDRFNVYVIKTVSPNAEFFGSNAKHAIDEDPAKALEYASKVPNLIEGRPMRVNVIYNNNSGGRSYCTMFEDNSYVCYAMDGVTNVLNHEAGGHGIGKLFDEYVEPGNESLTLPEENKTYLDNVWSTLGWGANVDWRSDPTEVKWAKFISDERYADEQMGLYEGSYLYQYGAYRPTENSMMRYNDMPFNAPSREEIYKRVMKESEGDSWTYDYETFVAFDVNGHSQFVNALTNAPRRTPKYGEKLQMRTAPPVFVKGAWRDALKKK